MPTPDIDPRTMRPYVDEEESIKNDFIKAKEELFQKELKTQLELAKIGRKYDQGKPRMELLQDFAKALEAVSIVSTIGAEKYNDGNWLHVNNGVKRYTGAMMRHFFQEPFEKEDKDGFLHAAAVAWNALARLELMLRGEENE